VSVSYKVSVRTAHKHSTSVVSCVQGKGGCLFSDPYETKKYALWSECRIFECAAWCHVVFVVDNVKRVLDLYGSCLTDCWILGCQGSTGILSNLCCHKFGSVHL
jgi:hypothetical protein